MEFPEARWQYRYWEWLDLHITVYRRITVWILVLQWIVRLQFRSPHYSGPTYFSLDFRIMVDHRIAVCIPVLQYSTYGSFDHADISSSVIAS